MGDIESNASYRENPNPITKVPRLEESTSIDLGNRVTASYTGAALGIGDYQNSGQVVSFIKNLERFCNDVAENKLLWTPEVIMFFGITDETLKREYEFAREEIRRSIVDKREGNVNGLGRRQSYVNIDRDLLIDSNEIVEEQPSGDSGSTKNSKKVNPLFFDQNQIQGRSAANSAAELGQHHATQQQQTVFTEDTNNTLHEEIRSGQLPISVKFLMWQDSNIGNYIEFKVQVTYHEGHE